MKCSKMYHFRFGRRRGSETVAGVRKPCHKMHSLGRCPKALRPAPLQLTMAEFSAELLAPTASETAPPRGQRTLFDTGFKRHEAGAQAASPPLCAQHTLVTAQTTTVLAQVAAAKQLKASRVVHTGAHLAAARRVRNRSVQ